MRPYTQGMQAAKEGKEFFENPFMNVRARIADGQAWFAGWCFAKNEMGKKTVDVDLN